MLLVTKRSISHVAVSLELERHKQKRAGQIGAPSRLSRGRGPVLALGPWAPAGRRPWRRPTRAPPSSRPAAAAQTRTPARQAALGCHAASPRRHVSTPMQQAGEISLAEVGSWLCAD